MLRKGKPPYPLRQAIMEILQEEAQRRAEQRGLQSQVKEGVEEIVEEIAMSSARLFNIIKSRYPDVSSSEFNKALMELELRGFINVETVERDLKNITARIKVRVKPI